VAQGHFFYRLIRLLLKGGGQLLYGHKVYGLEHVPEGKGLIVANHASFLDPPLIAISFSEEVHFLARSSLFDRYGLSFLISHLNAHPLPMDKNGASAFKKMLKLLSKGCKIVLFPEGQRTPDGELQVIRGGASKLAITSNSPLIPVYIAGSYSIWPKGKRFPRLWGYSACIIGSPIYLAKPTPTYTKAVIEEQLTIALAESLRSLKCWYDSGANGSPP